MAESEAEFNQKREAAIKAHREEYPVATLVYSEQDAAEYGYVVVSIPDGKGGRKEIKHTGVHSDKDIQSGQEDIRPGQKVVWQGKHTDYLVVRQESPKNGFPPIKEFSSISADYDFMSDYAGQDEAARLKTRQDLEKFFTANGTSSMTEDEERVLSSLKKTPPKNTPKPR